jgi:hypothetical protein
MLRFERREEDRQSVAVLATLQERATPEEKARLLLQQKIEQLRNRQGISAPTDG